MTVETIFMDEKEYRRIYLFKEVGIESIRGLLDT